ncbi:SpoIIE family protein phosphatase [Streptomyces sp. NPDC058947]|uniref:SpoIIE family protein phosphatase n=1 Tax=Streptomyces sp. NPDC058947 TaxID=3346675 RepID=UPI0036B20079
MPRVWDIPVRDSTRVRDARVAAEQAAALAGLDERRTAAAALVATELATNLLKHAEGGQVLIDLVDPPVLRDVGEEPRVVQIAAIDHGPGIQDVPAALRDGFSTTRSLGAGLGTCLRLADDFGLHSTPGRGTVAVARVGSTPAGAVVPAGTTASTWAGEGVAAGPLAPGGGPWTGPDGPAAQDGPWPGGAPHATRAPLAAVACGALTGHAGAPAPAGRDEPASSPPAPRHDPTPTDFTGPQRTDTAPVAAGSGSAGFGAAGCAAAGAGGAGSAAAGADAAGSDAAGGGTAGDGAARAGAAGAAAVGSGAAGSGAGAAPPRYAGDPHPASGAPGRLPSETGGAVGRVVGEVPAGERSGALARVRAGGVNIPYGGAEYSGDAWTWVRAGDRVTLMLADGLGHGPEAARASSAAVAALHRWAHLSPAEALRHLHDALRGTRGAAVALAQLDLRAGRLRFAGIGNVAGRLRADGTWRHLLSRPGIVGVHRPTTLREEEAGWADDRMLILHTDGLPSRWTPPSDPGAPAADPAVTAAVTIRDASSPARPVRDDTAVAVLSPTPPERP